MLDYVANTRVKTPTAAAEVLLRRVGDAYARLVDTGQAILATVNANISAQKQHIAYFSGLLPALARNVTERNRQRVGQAAGESINAAVAHIAGLHRQRLEAMAELLEALSPEATLRRGYSITRIAGRAVTDSSGIPPHAVVETQLAAGKPLVSVVADMDSL